MSQLLELYDMGDKQQTQLLRTYELAKSKLIDLKYQRDKMEETITELWQLIQWGKRAHQLYGFNEKSAIG